MPLPKELPGDFSTQVDDRQVFRNRYILGVRLGAGNFGTAYLVYDKEEKEDEDKQKVMKQICVGTVDPGESVDAMREAHLLARLQHRNIVQFHESFLNGQFFCIITEFCDGGDLDEKLKAYKESDATVEEGQIVTWLKELLEALKYMHVQRILHRDLKTKNIFLKDNQMKIGDFGISKILMGTSDKASTFVGTPYYMSPELLQHEGYDEKCDMWSLGCVLYEICCLKHAFEGQSLMAVMYKIVTGDIPELPKLYSQALNIVLSKMLVRDVSLRMRATEILQMSIFKVSNFKNLEKSNLTPRERLRLKKQKAADEKFRRHQELAARNRKENTRRHQESVTRNFHHTSIEDALREKKSRSPRGSMAKKPKNSNNNNAKSLPLNKMIPQDEERESTLQANDTGENVNFHQDSPVVDSRSKTFHASYEHPQAFRSSATLPAGGVKELHDLEFGNATLKGTSENIPIDPESTLELAKSLAKDGYIPEDALLAETFYSLEEDFEVDSSDLEVESDFEAELPDDHIQLSDSEYKEMLGLMEDALVLDESTVVHRVKPRLNAKTSDEKQAEPNSTLTKNVMDGQIANMRQKCVKAMGQEIFDKAHQYLRGIWSNRQIPVAPDYTLAMQKLQDIVHDNNKCFLLEQLVYLENQKQVY